MELGNLSQKLLVRIKHDLYMENQNDCVDIFLKKLGYNDLIEEKMRLIILKTRKF